MLFFRAFDFAQEQYGAPLQEAVPVMVQQVVSNEANRPSEKVEKEFKVLNLINAYRTYGHLLTQINPLATREPQLIDLSIERYGLSSADLDIVFDSAKEIRAFSYIFCVK